MKGRSVGTQLASGFLGGLLCALGTVAVAVANDKGSGVVDTVHNLSVSGPGEIKSVTEKEVCKFCHIPHSAVLDEPLWGHSLARGQYEMPRSLSRGGDSMSRQPDGSSRLCLSCHDGTVALGEIGRDREVISMTGTDRLTTGRRGFLGSDLSGGHPISIVVDASSVAALDPQRSDMTIRPLASIQADPDVKLDSSGKIQCTSCHDPHVDAYYERGRVPRFSVKPSVTEICTVCHELR